MPNNKPRRRNRKGKNDSQSSISPNNDPANLTSHPAKVADFTRALRKYDAVHARVAQWINYGVVTSTSAANGYYAFSVGFSDLPDNANYSSTFDQYRIDFLEFHILPTSSACLPSASNSYAFCYIVHDYDDATAPASLSTLLSYDNCTVLAPGEKHVRRIKPHIAVAATSSAAASITGARNVVAPWIDITSTSVQHYGVKIAVVQSTSTNLSSWQVFVKAFVSLKGVR